MTAKWNLSERVAEHGNKTAYYRFYFEEDVREFIRRLKEELDLEIKDMEFRRDEINNPVIKNHFSAILIGLNSSKKKIDTLAGEELI